MTNNHFTFMFTKIFFSLLTFVFAVLLFLTPSASAYQYYQTYQTNYQPTFYTSDIVYTNSNFCIFGSIDSNKNCNYFGNVSELAARPVKSLSQYTNNNCGYNKGDRVQLNQFLTGNLNKLDYKAKANHTYFVSGCSNRFVIVDVDSSDFAIQYLALNPRFVSRVNYTPNYSTCAYSYTYCNQYYYNRYYRSQPFNSIFNINF
jgi:hypothetical protein